MCLPFFCLRSALLKSFPCCFPSPVRLKTETCQSVKFQKGPPYPHAHAVTSQTCPTLPLKRLSYLNPEGSPDCASGRSGSALQCVGSTPPADMCTKVSGFAFLVQARTCGWGQGCNRWRHKTTGQHVHSGSHASKNVKVAFHGGFEWGKAFCFVCFIFFNKMDILFHHHQAPGDSVRVSYSQELLTLPPPTILSGTALIFVKKTAWRPHLSATELTHSKTMQEHSMVQCKSSL